MQNQIRFQWLLYAAIGVTGILLLNSPENVISGAGLQAAPPAQTAAVAPIRLGEIARGLSEQDIASLQLVLPSGRKPWLLIGDPAQVRTYQSVEAYLAPETTSPEIRRGSMIRLRRRVTDPAKPEPWEIVNNVQQSGPAMQGLAPDSGPYAQVVIAGRAFDQFLGDQDTNRPFRVFGIFDDAELISLVTFIRSKPPVPNSPIAISDGPIRSVVRETNGEITIHTRLEAMASQIIRIQKQGQSWVIIRTGRAMA